MLSLELVMAKRVQFLHRWLTRPTRSLELNCPESLELLSDCLIVSLANQISSFMPSLAKNATSAGVLCRNADSLHMLQMPVVTTAAAQPETSQALLLIGSAPSMVEIGHNALSQPSQEARRPQAPGLSSFIGLRQAQARQNSGHETAYPDGSMANRNSRPAY